MERKPRTRCDKKESRPIRTVWNENNDLSGGVIIGVFSNMPIQMESAVCDVNRKKGTAFSIRRWLKTQVQKLYVRSKDTETPAGHAGNQTVFFSWRVRTESSFRIVCLKFDCLTDNRCSIVKESVRASPWKKGAQNQPRKNGIFRGKYPLSGNR